MNFLLKKIKLFWWKTVIIFDDATQAKAACGMSVIQQFVEIIALKLGQGHLSRKEYYNYRLYDSTEFQWEDKKRFFGKVMENRLVNLLKMNRWGIVAHDKYLFNQFFEHLGFPVAKIYGMYQSTHRYINEPLSTNKEELKQFFQNQIDYPFVSKPMYGIYGRNIATVLSLDKETNVITLTNKKELDLNAFIESICQSKGVNAFNQDSFLFQELLRPPREIADLTANRLCTIRFIVIVTKEGPEITRALWKIMSGTNMVDNFVHGNVLATVDINTGKVNSAVQGVGYERHHVKVHPDTNKKLYGFALPHWQEAKELCLRAATAIPELPMQGWDIAMTDRGPVLLEVNLVGGVALSQYGGSEGIYDEKLKNLLHQYGFK